MTKTTYQPELIQRFADRLYARSAGIIVVSGLLGVMIGFAVDPFVASSLPVRLAAVLPNWATPLAFGIIGVLQGMERAFLLKLQAQTALCQMQIERNTRKSDADSITA